MNLCCVVLVLCRSLFLLHSCFVLCRVVLVLCRSLLLLCCVVLVLCELLLVQFSRLDREKQQLFNLFFHLFPKVLYKSVLMSIIKVPQKSVLLSIITFCHLSLTYHTQRYFIKALCYLAKTWLLVKNVTYHCQECIVSKTVLGQLPPTPKLTLSQTLTLTGGQCFSSAIVWLPTPPATVKLTLTLTQTPTLAGGRGAIFIGGQLSGYQVSKVVRREIREINKQRIKQIQKKQTFCKTYRKLKHVYIKLGQILQI